MAAPHRRNNRSGLGSNHTEPGIVSNVIPNNGVRRKAKTKMKPKQKTNVSQVEAIVERRLLKVKVVKYLEVLATGVTMTTSGAFLDITAITQGPSQNERIADTVWIQSIDFSLGVTTANADVFNLARITFIKWKQSSVTALPTTLSVFSNWSNALVHSFLNFERRADYAVVTDNKMNLTGLATVPTINSQHLIERRISMNSSRIDYDQGVTSGVGKVYVFFGSDSSALPFPVININFRIWYYDD